MELLLIPFIALLAMPLYLSAFFTLWLLLSIGFSVDYRHRTDGFGIQLAITIVFGAILMLMWGFDNHAATPLVKSLMSVGWTSVGMYLGAGAIYSLAEWFNYCRKNGPGVLAGKSSDSVLYRVNKTGELNIRKSEAAKLVLSWILWWPVQALGLLLSDAGPWAFNKAAWLIKTPLSWVLSSLMRLAVPGSKRREPHPSD